MRGEKQGITLKVLSYNVQKTKPIMGELLRDKTTWEYDVIAIQEPWRNNNPDREQPTTHNPVPDRFYLHYPAYAKTRTCFFISKRLPKEDLRIRDYGTDLTALTILNQGANRDQKITVYNIYNPNPAPPYNRMHSLPALSRLPKLNVALERTRSHHNIVVGDFNIHHELWGGEGVISNSTKQAEFLIEMMERHGLELCIERGLKTRPGRNEEPGSTIDLALATEDIMETLVKAGIEGRLNKCSDHLPIGLELGIQLQREAQFTRWRYDQTDREIFSNTLRDLLPQPQFGTRTERIDQVAERIAEALSIAREASTPKARISPKSKPGWNEETTEAIKNARRLRRRYNATGEMDDFVEWQRANREKKNAIRKADRDTHRTRVSNTRDLKGLFQLARWAKNRNSANPCFTPDIKDAEGDIQRDLEGKAQAFARTFFPTPPPADLSDIQGADYPSPIRHMDFREAEIREIIRNLPPDKAPGPDQIPNRMLKWAEPQITPILTRLFNKCIQAGYCPKHFRRSTTVVLRKPGKSDYTTVKAYRPVALLNTIGKIMDCAVAARISYDVEAYQLLPKAHMGGRKARSIEHAIHTVLETVSAAWQMPDRLVASLLMLDVSGAYDNCSHERLIHNLRKRRIAPEIANWVKSWLSGRSTSIRLTEGTTKPFETSTGIPQGSPISPILYLFYNADLMEIADDEPKGTVAGYIDDTNIIAIGRSTEETCETLNRIHQKAMNWADTHASVFAPQKYEVIHFIDKQHKTTNEERHRILKLDLKNGATQALEPKTSARFLGVRVDSELSGEAHLEHVKESTGKQLGALAAIAGSTWGVSAKGMKQLYRSTVVPKMMTGITAWMPADIQGKKGQREKFMKELNQIQKRALCHVAGAFKSTAVEALEVETGVPPIRDTVEKAIVGGVIRIVSSPAYAQVKAARETIPPRWRGKRPRLKSPLQQHEESLLTPHILNNVESIRPSIRHPHTQTPELVIEGAEEAKKTHLKEREEGILKYKAYKEWREEQTDEPRPLEWWAIPSHQKRLRPTIIYASGSATERGLGAAAQELDLEDTEREGTKMKLFIGPSTFHSIKEAELAAIKIAMGIALKKGPYQNLQIFTKGRDAITQIKNPGRKAGQYIVEHIQWLERAMRNKSIKCTIHWLPEGSCEIQTRISAEAREATGVTPNGPCQRAQAMRGVRINTTAIKQKQRELADKRWKRKWEKSEHGRELYRICKEPQKAMKLHNNLAKAASAVLTQMRTGKIGLQNYLHRINKADSPNCVCGKVDQTVKHVLLTCTKFAELRRRIWEGNQPPDIRVLLNDVEHATKAIKFMLQTRLLEQFLMVTLQTAL
jgi:exonuclease III